MEAKETVMSDHEMVAEMEARHWGGNTILHRTPLDEREIQAEISFKAGQGDVMRLTHPYFQVIAKHWRDEGRREVTEYVDTCLVATRKGNLYVVKPKAWQSKLKEWGL